MSMKLCAAMQVRKYSGTLGVKPPVATEMLSRTWRIVFVLSPSGYEYTHTLVELA